MGSEVRRAVDMYEYSVRDEPHMFLVVLVSTLGLTFAASYSSCDLVIGSQRVVVLSTSVDSPRRRCEGGRC